MKKGSLLPSLAAALACAAMASAQEMPAAIGLSAGQAYALAAAGYVVQTGGKLR